MNILITALGSMSAISVLKSVRESFPESVITGTDINRKEWLFSASHVDFFAQSPRANDELYVPFILKLCASRNINLIMPLTDPEVDVFSENKSLFDQLNVVLAIASPSTIIQCRNKLSLFTKFKHSSIVKAIPTYSVHEISKELDYPMVAKPSKGRSSEGLKFLNSKKELDAISDSSAQYIIQPFLSGTIITVDFIIDKNGIFFALPRFELIRTVNGAGIAVQIEEIPTLSQICKVIADELQIIGCVNMEFIHHNNEYYLMDINPRFSAGIAFSKLAGYDFVKNHINSFLQRPIEQAVFIKKLIATKYYSESILTTSES